MADPPDYYPLPEAARPFDPSESPKALLRPAQHQVVTDHQIGFDTRAVEINQYVKSDPALGIDSLTLWQGHYDELSDYLDDALAASRRDAIKRELVGHARFSDSVTPDANRYEIPVRIPEWAKRLGLSKPALSLSGSYTLQLKASSHWSNLEEQLGTANKFPDFSPEQIPNVNLTGNIGKFVSMTMMWNQEGFGATQSQDLHLKYAGEKPEDTEDDILQEAEFGLIQLSLPGTSLTGYSEAASGLLGLKAKMRFGDLDLTIVGGTEQGQTQKQKIGRSAKETVSPLINDKDVDVGRDFFLSYEYRRKATQMDPAQILQPQGLRVFAMIKVADETAHPDWKPFYKGSAIVRDSTGRTTRSTDAKQGWRELANTEWFWDRGVLRLRSGFGGTGLAVRWANSTSDRQGTVNGLTVDGLALLSDDLNLDDPDLRPLQLRNRYYRLGYVAQADRKNVKIRILDRSTTKSDPSVDASGQDWAKVFGLVDNNGIPFYDDLTIFDWANSAIIFPKLEPFREFGAGAIYDTLRSALPSMTSSRFAIEITSRTSSDSIKIGSRDMASVSGSNCVDILEGSEVLTLNGSTRLEKGKDYDVQYQTGTITLLSERARDPSADIAVDFSCRPFFSLESRTVAGARLEYQLPSLGKQSVLGGTFLYRSESVTDPRPQLQREPNRAMLWGANLRLAGESEMLTDWAARIPFSHAKGDSKWRLEIEGAQSWNNPNYEGYALVDDFENARQDNDLPVYAQSWFQSSPPGGVLADRDFEDSLDYRHKGTFVWSSNASEALHNIYPDFDDGSSAAQRTTVLQLKLRSNDGSTGAGYSWGGIMKAFPNSWRENSSARYLEVVANSNGGELTFDFGQISEDLSIAGETPDGNLQGENINADGKVFATQQNDFGLDGQPDTTERTQSWKCQGRNCSSTLYDASKITDSASRRNDPSGDNFQADVTSNDPSPKVNGTEENNKFVDGGTNTWFDTEDLNRDGLLETANNFDRYTIRLGGKEASVSQKLRGGWRLYRIPLENPTRRKGSGAKWNQLDGVRIFYHGMNTKNGANIFEEGVQIARMSLVGNQWKSSGRLTKNDDTVIVDTTATADWTSTTQVIVPDTSRISATVINNLDDNSTYQNWGVPDTKDASSGARLKEQALRLVYKGLHRDFGTSRPDTGTAMRVYESPRDFTLYRNLSMLLYHQALQGVQSAGQDPVRVGIQFGSGISDMANAPYYEYSFNPVPARCPLGDPTCSESDTARRESMRQSWKDNQIHIALARLTSLKTHRPPVTSGGVIDSSYYREALNWSEHEGPIGRDDSLAIKGDPSLSSIRWMRIWVRPNAQKAGGTASLASGEIWVNDLKVDAPYDGIGTAFRGAAQVNFSDLLDLSASSDYQGGDFVPMGQKRPELSSQKSTAHASATAALSIEKFLPEAWQARLPLNYTITAGVDRPWARPGSDQSLTRDGLKEIVSDVWDGNMRRDSSDLAHNNSKAYQTMSVSRTLSSSWSRSRAEGPGLSPFLVNTFFARPKLSWTYNEQGTLAPDHRDSSFSHSVRLDYDFSPPPAPQLKPFGSSTSKWVPGFVQGFTFQPWPNVINTTLGDLEYLDGSQTTLAADRDTVLRQTINRRAGLSHSLNTEWQMFDFLRWGTNLRTTRSWSRPDTSTHRNDEAKYFNPATGLVDAWPLIFDWDTTQVHIPGLAGGGTTTQEFGFLRNEDGRQVGLSADLSPRIFPWLTTTGGYQASATANRDAPLRRLVGFDTTYVQFWRHDHTDNFRSSLRLDIPSILRSVQKLGPDSWNKPLESTRRALDRWRWSGLGIEYSVDNRNSGIRQTLDYTSSTGLDGWGLLGWQSGLGDGYGMRNPIDVVTGSRSKSGFGQYEPARLDDPGNYPGLRDTVPSELGADRASLLNTRSYRMTASSEATIPGLLLRVEPGLTYLISWDERWSEPWSVDTSVTWPQISVNTSLPNFVNRVGFLSGWLESITANNSSSWDRTQKIYPYRARSNTDNRSWRFAPLVGIQAKTKGNWSFDNRFNASTTYSTLRNKLPLKGQNGGADGVCPESMGLPKFYSDPNILFDRCFELKGSSENRNYELGDEGTATYRVQTRRGVQLLKWFVKLDNDLVITFRGGWTHSWKKLAETDPVTAEPTPTQQLEDVTTVYAGSNATYNFTSKLVAQFDAKYQQTGKKVKDDSQGETVNHDISFLASLQYRF